MARTILFKFGEQSFTALLHETPVADAIWDSLPFQSTFNTWGDEIYFDCGVAIDPENAQPTVNVGDVAYWPPGQAICLFWGPTPTSGPDEIRPASPVAVFGAVVGDPRALAKVR